MINSYLKVMLRHFSRHRIYTLINLSGLTIGLSCCFLIAIYIGNELAYDSQHQNRDRIYRIIREKTEGDETRFLERTSGNLATQLSESFPEIESVVRIHRWTRWIEVAGKDATNEPFCIADANILNVFDFPLLYGDKQSALAREGTAVLTRRLALKLFGREDVVGETVNIREGDYLITGVIQNLPRPSSIQFDMLTASLSAKWKKGWIAWDNGVPKIVETFVCLKPGADPDILESKLQGIVDDSLYESVSEARYHLQPLSRIHLYSKQDFGKPTEVHGGKPQVHGDIRNLYLFGLLGVMILSIACVNFVNLTTARAAGRAREVGLRKVVGARRKQLIGQFLAESIAMAGVAFFLALGIAQLTLPTLAAFMGKSLQLAGLGTTPVLLAAVATLGVAIMAGSYPAFVLSAFDPVTVLKGNHPMAGPTGIRKGLVFVQFSIGILLVAATWGVHSQQAYLRNRSLGFDSSLVLKLPLFSHASGNPQVNSWRLRNAYKDIKAAFESHPNVLSATSSRGPMGQWAAPTKFVHDTNDAWFANMIGVDEDFLPFYKLELTAGRNFTDFHAGTTNTYRRDNSLDEQYILNETAVRQLGWENPVGKRLAWNVGGTFFPDGLRRGVVIGIVKDFHVQSLHEPIAPLVLITELKNTQHIYLKITPGALSETLAHAKTVWDRTIPNRPFTYSFLDEEIKSQYDAETRMSQLFSGFAGLSIFIACLGLFGLSTLDAERRRSEVGIRKVLGASVTNIYTLVVRDSLKIVLISFIVASPIAWFSLESWLQSFPHRTNLNPSGFLAIGILAAVIAAATVSIQTLRVAWSDPAQILRSK